RSYSRTNSGALSGQMRDVVHLHLLVIVIEGALEEAHTVVLAFFFQCGEVKSTTAWNVPVNDFAVLVGTLTESLEVSVLVLNEGDRAGLTVGQLAENVLPL